MPLVSIVIPVYNRVAELERALHSVLAQTFTHHEIIVVDDHSTIDIQSALLNAPVRLLKSQGKGVSAARNTGIHASQGEFIALLDSDDEWLPTKLEKQISYLKQHPQMSFVHTNEIWQRHDQILNQPSKYKKSGGDIFVPCTQNCVISPSTVMLRKSLLRDVGLFDESFVVCEDFDLWLRITSQHEVGFIEEPLTVKHGGHSDQLSMQFHSMDLWRARALYKCLQNPNLSADQSHALQKSLLQKSEILLKGFTKHRNFEHLDEVQKYKNSALSLYLSK